MTSIDVDPWETPVGGNEPGARWIFRAALLEASNDVLLPLPYAQASKANSHAFAVENQNGPEHRICGFSGLGVLEGWTGSRGWWCSPEANNLSVLGCRSARSRWLWKGSKTGVPCPMSKNG